jgi:hypothetical protein
MDYLGRRLSVWVGREVTQSHTRQMVGSLIVAVLIVLVTIAVVTAKLGPDGDRRRKEREEEDDNSGRGSHRKTGLMLATQPTRDLRVDNHSAL